MIPSKITLEDVKTKPELRITLPGLVRLGDHLSLNFTVHRLREGRQEELKVDGVWRVTSMSITGAAQSLSVESLRSTPSWRSVRKPKRSWTPSEGRPFNVTG